MDLNFGLRTGIRIQSRLVMFVLLIITALWIFNNLSLADNKYFSMYLPERKTRINIFKLKFVLK